MVFSSTIFLFYFLPITLFVYFILRRDSLRNYWLLIVSIIFFAWSQPNYLWIIIFNIFINYTGAMLIDKYCTYKKLFLFLTVFLNLIMLFYYKYFDFTIDSINKIFNTNWELKNIILPIGISFFTFQGMSYTIDVYRKDVQVQKNILKLGLYIMLFPQLIAGPIVRYTDIVNEINYRKISIGSFCSGIERFIIGLGKKAIIANTMASMVDSVWNQSGGAENSFISVAWLVTIAYTLQIYFDFSGYSDMAIGLGRMFGFNFQENFKLPYTSKSITEFWRKWHISLSSWFRDYVYIPLGGNRKHVYLNLSIVFLLTGIWHGAAWHFIIWGLWNGLFILLERYMKLNAPIAFGKHINGKIKTFFEKFYTLFIINIGLVLFRAPHTRDAVELYLVMFGIKPANMPGYSIWWFLDRWTLAVFIIGIIVAGELPTKLGNTLKVKLNSFVCDCLKYISLLIILILSMIRIVSGTYNPFIYFQF